MNSILNKDITFFFCFKSETCIYQLLNNPQLSCYKIIPWYESDLQTLLWPNISLSKSKSIF